jgi:primosomal protein N' (replication factor Y) (superfamily II helicase)
MPRAGETVEVLLPVALERTYTYRIPFGEELSPGDVVRVPLAGRDTVGVVWEGDGRPRPCARDAGRRPRP